MAEPKEVKSKRDIMAERLKAKYPDKEFADDESLWSQANDDYDEYDGKLSEYANKQKHLDNLNDIVRREPRVAGFLADLGDGKDLVGSLINLVGTEGAHELIDNPEKQQEFAEENKKYLDRVAKNKELEAQWDETFPQSMAELDALQSERGWSDEQADAILQRILSVVDDAVRGIYKRETLELFANAESRDSDLKKARAEGEAQGKASRARAELRKPDGGDGVPMLGGGGVKANASKNRSIFDIASEA